MGRFGLMAAVFGLVLAVCVPVRAESEGNCQDEVAMARANAARQQASAARKSAKAVPLPKATVASSDTLVVAAAGDQPGFTMVGENVTYTDPNFVPYKLREAARRARAKADLATIP